MLQWLTDLFYLPFNRPLKKQSTVIDFKEVKSFDEWYYQLSRCILCDKQCWTEDRFSCRYLHCDTCRMSFECQLTLISSAKTSSVQLLMETMSGIGYPNWRNDHYRMHLSSNGVFCHQGYVYPGVQLSNQTTIDIRKFKEEELDKYLVLL